MSLSGSTLSSKEENGKKIFHGLPPYDTLTSCVSCHYISEPDTFCWYPSAREIAIISENLDSVAFEEVVLYPFISDLIMEAHSGYQLTAVELEMLKTYVVSLKTINEKNFSIYSRHIYIAVSILFLFLLLLDSFKFRILNRKLNIILSMVFMIILLGFILSWCRNWGLQKKYQPKQVLKFSHKVHATDNKIDCRFCHSQAWSEQNGGITSLNTCMVCHLVIREGSNSGTHELNKLFNTYNKGLPVPWTKVNSLPDHVRFDHGIHTSVGEIDCSVCHGNVSQMHEVKKTNSFTMKSCLECHKSTPIKNETDSNSFSNSGAWDCVSCHQ